MSISTIYKKSIFAMVVCIFSFYCSQNKPIIKDQSLKELPINTDKIENFNLRTLKDEKISLKSITEKLDDGLLIIAFAQVTCEPCKKELPELLHFFDKNRKRGIKLWILFEENDDDQVKSFLDKNSIDPLDSYVSSDMLGTVKDRAKVTGFPTTFVINKSQTVVLKSEGLSELKNLLWTIETRFFK